MNSRLEFKNAGTVEELLFVPQKLHTQDSLAVGHVS